MPFYGCLLALSLFRALGSDLMCATFFCPEPRRDLCNALAMRIFSWIKRHFCEPTRPTHTKSHICARARFINNHADGMRVMLSFVVCRVHVCAASARAALCGE